MTTKHFFPDTSGLVLQALDSFAHRNPHLHLDKQNRVVVSKTHSPAKITLISGGGSGHEPAWSGYVGDGMLSAAVCGDVFASPSTKQIMAAIRSTPSDVGIILCITNYTGDTLHFGLAREKGRALGHLIEVVSMSEDAALGRQKAGLVGRRGLAGNLLVLKLIGAAAQSSWSFERVLKLGRLGNDQLVTIGTSLDHCHIPGRAHHESVPADACVLGMGIHNEPGLRTISPMPSPEDLMREMFLYLLDPADTDRAFVQFKPSDQVVMLVNNFGGLSNLELDGLTNVAREQLRRDWSISPVRIYTGIFETSLNGPGFSVTLGNLTGIATTMEIPVDEIIAMLDAPTTAPAWPKNAYFDADESNEAAESRYTSNAQMQDSAMQDMGPKVSQSLVVALTEACKRAIAAEPDITKFDIQMGDGDCGEAVESVCHSILAKLPNFHDMPVFTMLDQLVDSVEDMGGSLGAILSILLTAFSAQLRGVWTSARVITATEVAESIGPAMDSLKQYTMARIGDRTVMDVLIPFCYTLQKSSDLEAAVLEAEKGAEKTKGMKARFGRATYVGEDRVEQQDDAPPDPGAHAAAVFLRGLVEG